ncbi:MAG TPA: MFS transporter [Vicinamibacteria bacterium]|nr:MFS transporter [Vicinamibacteria bacterium]
MIALLPREAWRRNQLVVCVAVFMVFMGFAFVLPFLPLYVRQLGVSSDEAAATWAGVLIGIAPLLAGLLAPVWGRLGDRYGQKPMAVRALVSYVILLALSGAVTTVWELLALRTAVGLFGGVGPLGLAMATALAPREQTGRAVGSVQSAQILAAAVGPLAGGVLAHTIGMRGTFVATAAACGIALLLLVFFYEEAPRVVATEDATRDGFGAVLAVPGVLPLMATLFLVNFIGRSFTPILPLHLQRMAVPASNLALSTGILISAYSVCAAASAALLGRATRRRDPRALLVATLVAGAAIVLPMGLVGRFPPFLGLAVLLGLAAGGSLTLCYTIGGLMVPSERRTTAFGFFSGAALFGGAVSPSIAGLLTRVHFKAIYWADAVLYVLLALALLPGALARRAQPTTSEVAQAAEGGA